MEEHDLMLASEVAVALRTSKMTVYRLIQRGELDVIRVGRAYRVKRASVQALLAGGGVSEQ